MKKDIHPKYNKDAKVRCSCGAEFEVGSTETEIKVEICSACHPLYTGSKKYVDTAGRLDKFRERQAKTEKIKETLQTKKKVVKEEKEETEQDAK